MMRPMGDVLIRESEILAVADVAEPTPNRGVDVVSDGVHRTIAENSVHACWVDRAKIEAAFVNIPELDGYLFWQLDIEPILIGDTAISRGVANGVIIPAVHPTLVVITLRL